MEKLISKLAEHQIDHKIIAHEQPIRTAREGADWFGIEVGQTAPTLILKSEAQYFALIISGDYGRVDLEELSAQLNFGPLSLAKPKQVEEITGYSIGAVSMIGHGLPTIVDRHLKSFDYIYGGTGNPLRTLKIAAEDVIRLNDVIAILR